MTDNPWQDEETLRELYERDGMTLPEIADELGCSNGTISNWFSEFGIDTTGHRKTDAAYTNPDVLEELFYTEGMSRQEIADRFDVTYRAINRWLRRHDLQPENPTLNHGYICTSGNGYSHFVDYTGSYVDDRVYIHRLLAVSEHGVDAVEGKHVHHKNRVPWDNRPENIEVMDESEHMKLHSAAGNG